MVLETLSSKDVKCSPSVIVRGESPVGKTTTTFILGHILHDNYGLRVLLVDGDSSMSLSSMCCGQENMGLYENANLYTVLTDDNCDINNCIIEVGGIYLLPSNQKLEEAERYIQSKGGNVNHVLKKKLKPVVDSGAFDVVLLDLKPTVTTTTRNFLVCSDYIVLVYQAEYQCLLDSKAIIEAIAEINEELEDIGMEKKKILGCVITMTNNTNLCKEVVEAIKESLKEQNIEVFNATIPRNVKISEATTQNLPSNLYAPKSAGNKAYEEVAKELLEKVRSDYE